MQTASESHLTVTFGPTSSILPPPAVAYAARYSSTFAEITPGVWRASFCLGLDPVPYARAHRLIQIVGTWKATEVEVSGSPEPLVPVLSMTECARGWLRRVGGCRAALPSGAGSALERCPPCDT